VTDDNELFHYGILRKSGRYPWGSGADSQERSRGFMGYVDGLKSKGLSEVQIARGFGISTTELRAARAIAKNEIHSADVALAGRLKAKGLSNIAIGIRMKMNESSVRALLDPVIASKRDVLVTTSNLLKDKIKSGGYLDIGAGTENHLGISSTKLSTAVAMLREHGYAVHNVQVAQLGTGKKTTIKVLAPPGTKYVDIVKNPGNIKSIAAYSEDGGHTYLGIQPPKNISVSRIGIRYAEQGGAKADGVIFIRPGVDELSLGSSRYAQVRIAVNGTHYLKGMAMYKNDLPAGTDLLFNTNKSDTGNKLDAMKPQKGEDNPFGSTIRQRHYTDAAGKLHLSAMNIVNEEGDWKDWSRSLSSQILSKQSTTLAKRQLDLALASRTDEFHEIMRLTNPVVRKKLLESFADGADAAAVHLKAAALPRQGTHVILPIESLKEGEVYAPNYRNGEKVALIRFPHGGTFEIPEATVNNKHAGARATLGNAIDAIGIHPKVAARLSGADFDGDTVLVVPNNRRELKTSPPLAHLKNFDPQTAYRPYDGMKTIDGGVYNAKTGKVDYGNKHPSGRTKQQQMGDVSNLITDMTIKGAKPDELARAVRHSMVVIDAEKHNLNYRQSYIDNGIASLKEKYQGRGSTGRLAGASTIVSRASSEVRVPDRRPRPASKGGSVDRVTGQKVYENTGEQFKDAKGRTIVRTTSSTKLAEAKDARSLSSGMPIENIYAAHSNSLKALANQARKSALTTGSLKYSPTANKTYASQVAKLSSDLNIALKNKPIERQAQLVANAVVAARRAGNPGMDSADLKKIKGQALQAARDRVGAKKIQIPITDDQWRAIQAGAISSSKLSQILDNADSERVRTLATPRAATVVTPSKLAIAKARLASGYTQAEIADSLGIPVSTLNSALHRGGG
jgi:DNA-binding CsgD family transcriptional regulator